ncbi:MAG TPA: PD-(D/E)XK nuclease family protein [Haliangiales bacterium]|nr:PD-(D/E)XK nuclease family protein [Haliangiales bacterium]
MHPTVAFILAVLGAALALVWILARVRRALAGLRARRRGRRAAQGELEAERLLAAAGFRVRERQVPLVFPIRCDGRELPIELRADILAERGGRRYVVEVKTGEAAPRLDTAGTRRQLLEYLVAYRADGVLLVDADRGAVHEVEFPVGDTI